MTTVEQAIHGLDAPVPIRDMDVVDALSCLGQHLPSGPRTEAEEKALNRAAAVIARRRGLSLCDGWCGQADAEPTISGEDIAWAQTRLACGDIADALLFLGRALEGPAQRLVDDIISALGTAGRL